MTVLVTGFTGKVGHEVAKSLKRKGIRIKCAARDVTKASNRYGDAYDFVQLDFANPATFVPALQGIEQIFLLYPPGGNLRFEKFLEEAKNRKVQHITYLSVKDVQFLPFIHHYKNEKLIKKQGIPHTFIRAGYFMQNLNDFLCMEIKERQRIFVPAGKGKTSFVDVRDLAEVISLTFQDSQQHRNKAYTVTGSEALDFFEVANKMTKILGKPISYTNPSTKEFKDHMLSRGLDKAFVNVVIGIHFPTKLGLAKGISADYEKLTGMKPTKIETYIKDYQNAWI
ncbi:SDR family oxidoreductase [Planococcus shenhongbingii]|uniref:SDR family oxidoreductase n=1 Tax=Planococcus shenhongbingii TaxID=3058398 RepID=A0ABT8NI85_9BACL|nr:SDR family oxidoreductase [Planococcus sp. N017]MDN7247616.1 SDR family oxidoreductase [Planococcus sp. N017]